MGSPLTAHLSGSQYTAQELGQYAYYPGSQHTDMVVGQFAYCPGSKHTDRVSKRTVTQAPHLVEHVADTGRQHEKPDEPAEPAAVGPADDVVPSDAEAASAAAAAGRSRPAGIGRLRWTSSGAGSRSHTSRNSHGPGASWVSILCGFCRYFESLLWIGYFSPAHFRMFAGEGQLNSCSELLSELVHTYAVSPYVCSFSISLLADD